MAHFIPSNKKKKDGSDSFLLVDADDYIYRFKYANKKFKIWKCVKLEERNCKAEVKTNLTVSKKIFQSMYQSSDTYFFC